MRALDHVTAGNDEVLNADGAMPAHGPEPLGLWPCQLKLNPTPPSRQQELGAEYIGKMWVSAADGRSGGEVYTITADSSAEPGFTGSIIVYGSTSALAE